MMMSTTRELANAICVDIVIFVNDHRWFEGRHRWLLTNFSEALFSRGSWKGEQGHAMHLVTLEVISVFFGYTE
jgi:hypothetical protein